MFKDTNMYKMLKNLCEILNLKHDLNVFRFSSPFWKADENSYMCFLSVLENEYDIIMSQKITRSKTEQTKITVEIINEIIEMLVEYTPDDENESTIDKRCVICLFNESKIKLVCGHTPICQKCFNILTMRNIKTCPLCRQ